MAFSARSMVLIACLDAGRLGIERDPQFRKFGSESHARPREIKSFSTFGNIYHLKGSFLSDER